MDGIIEDEKTEKQPMDLLIQSRRKPMPIWKLLTIDVIIAATCINVFALFHHVLPRTLHNNGQNIIDGGEVYPTFKLPSNTTRPDQSYESSKKYAKSPFDRTVTTLNEYKNDSGEIFLRKVEIGEKEDKITYYVADVFTKTTSALQTAFAKGKYGVNLKEPITEIAKDNNAILAISGDYYTNNEVGVVIRNGVYYRSEPTPNDICVLFLDGTMKTYSPKEFNIDEVIEQDAWQAWTFGPRLLDDNGNVLESFNCTSYIKKTHPRAAIGYVTPGHYVLLVVDGRVEGYSIGVDIKELAQIMADEGCIAAYNLDGGKTACMTFDGVIVNKPAGGGRDIGDIVYIGE